jgi:hypothetical protein
MTTGPAGLVLREDRSMQTGTMPTKTSKSDGDIRVVDREPVQDRHRFGDRPE